MGTQLLAQQPWEGEAGEKVEGPGCGSALGTWPVVLGWPCLCRPTSQVSTGLGHWGSGGAAQGRGSGLRGAHTVGAGPVLSRQQEVAQAG